MTAEMTSGDIYLRRLLWRSLVNAPGWLGAVREASNRLEDRVISLVTLWHLKWSGGLRIRFRNTWACRRFSECYQKSDLLANSISRSRVRTYQKHTVRSVKAYSRAHFQGVICPAPKYKPTSTMNLYYYTFAVEKTRQNRHAKLNQIQTRSSLIEMRYQSLNYCICRGDENLWAGRFDHILPGTALLRRNYISFI